jgi:hypothetical protein
METFGGKRYDDSRLEDLSDSEKRELEGTLVVMYLIRAREEGLPIKLERDPNVYQGLQESGTIFNDTEARHLFLNEAGQIGDMHPIVYHLMDTPEAKFYAKLLLSEEDDHEQVPPANWPW